MRRAYRSADSGGFGALRREVALDQRVRELPLRARKLHAVALELARRRAGVTETLPLGGQLADQLHQRLHRYASIDAAKTRWTQWPQLRCVHLGDHHRHWTRRVEHG